MTEMVKVLYSNLESVLNTVLVLFSVYMTIKAAYNKIKSNFKSKITGFINDAEEMKNLSNSEKMEQVVLWIKDLIPRIFKVAFNDATLEQIAENVYQDMKKFMNSRLKNQTGMNTKQIVDTINALSDDPESIVSKDTNCEEKQ